MRFDPFGGTVEWLCVERQDVLSTAHVPAHQTGPLEQPDVLRYRVERNREWLGDVGHPGVTAREELENGAASGICQSDQDVVEVGCRAGQYSPLWMNIIQTPIAGKSIPHASNSTLTDLPTWMRRIASASSGAIDRIFICGRRFSGGTGTVSVVTISAMSG